jgi:hypothetical protein
MDYYQGVVIEYLRANRARFVNTECLIQLEAGDNPDRGTHWYCDAVAIDLRESAVFLCEISYSQTLSSLIKRLDAWRNHWDEIRAALVRDCAIEATWPVQPWIFVPSARKDVLERRLPIIGSGRLSAMPMPKVTYLEDVAPWNYRSWNGKEYAAAEKVMLRSA